MIACFVYLGLTLIGLGMVYSKHGQPKEPEKYNGVRTTINVIVQLALLYWMGAFDSLLK